MHRRPKPHQRPRRAARAAIAIVLVRVALIAGCALNPATRRLELNLINEPEEIELGRAADRQIVESIGLTEQPALASELQALGEAITKVSERPALPWTFRLLDASDVNAFALPGGFIYVTRGLIAHLLSAAELAAVLAHEVAHVTARHGAAQYSRLAIAQRGVGLLRVLDPQLRHVGAVASGTAGLALLRHSRGDEAEADALALRYLSRAGRRPEALAHVLDMLVVMARAGDSAGAPTWLSTHPDPADRLRAVQIALGGPTAPPPLDPAFLAHLRGLQLGDDPRQGLLYRGVYYCPARRYQLPLPPEWSAALEGRAMIAADPAKDVMIMAGLGQAPDLDAAEAAFLKNPQVRPGARWRPELSDPYAFAERRGGYFQLVTEGSVLSGLVLFVALEPAPPADRGVLVLLAAGAPAEFDAAAPLLEATFRALAPIDDPVLRDIQPARLDLITVDRPTPLRELTGDAPLAAVAALNRLPPDAIVARDRPLKIIRGGLPP